MSTDAFVLRRQKKAATMKNRCLFSEKPCGGFRARLLVFSYQEYFYSDFICSLNSPLIRRSFEWSLLKSVGHLKQGKLLMPKYAIFLVLRTNIERFF